MYSSNQFGQLHVNNHWDEITKVSPERVVLGTLGTEDDSLRNYKSISAEYLQLDDAGCGATHADGVY